MSDLTGKEAKTIHRLLQVEWDENDQPTFAKNEKNNLDCDALVIDELSMVDVTIFEAVLRALPLGCRLILVGDSDQLPSVGPGNVLGDLIASEMLPVVRLNEIFRQSMQSLIVTNAHRIVAGEMPDLSVRTSDFFFCPAAMPQMWRRPSSASAPSACPPAMDIPPWRTFRYFVPVGRAIWEPMS